MDGLTEGRIVHYVSEDRVLGHCQPAIVTQVFKVNEKPPENGCSNLAVIPDGANDYFGSADNNIGLHWKTSRVYGKDLEQGHWHWPQECPRGV